MCGIFAIFLNNKNSVNNCNGNSEKNVDNSRDYENLREMAYRHSGRQRHRGPDFTGVNMLENDEGVFMHERLAIMCVKTGRQPHQNVNEDMILSANGEIYNYLDLSNEIRKIRGFYKPRSDCELILSLYEEFGLNLFKYINGMFAFVLYDKRTKNILIGRDPIGIIPMYVGEDPMGNLWVASEMKCFVGKCIRVESFPPGTYRFGQIGNLKSTEFYQPAWIKTIPNNATDLNLLRQHLESAVRSHLMCDSEVPFGALLSGGIDSSLISSVITKIMRETKPNFQLKTYSVGLKGAPDFKYSKMVADYIDSDHTEVHFTVEQGLDCIRDIIYKLESYDITTIRASIPMYILSRYIKSDGIKMVLSGEGADEIFGGYLYFFKSPNYDDFHHETISRVKCLHLSDCLRANKSTMAWGVELRVPFLDTDFINYAMSLDPKDRIPGSKNGFQKNKSTSIEKYILRAAFNDNYLPDEVLWRQKEQFSDGVGYDWIDTIRKYSSSHVSDLEFDQAKKLYPINSPETKEAFYYRKLFEEMFPGDEYAKTVMKWVPRTDWGCSADPSGRAQTDHLAFK